jgi:hypothetical protein
MKLAALILLLTLMATISTARLQLSSRGKARCPILTQPGATPAEKHAASELAAALERITGAKFEVREGIVTPEAAIIVGPGPLAAKHFPDVLLDTFGPEQVAIRTRDNRLLLAGGGPRGTLYAVYRFLQDQCGVRWWTPWASTHPRKPSLSIPELNIDAKPAFEYRAAHWELAFDENWAVRNGINSQFSRLTEKTGGKIDYKGFVHTFYPLVPPEEHFAKHPEWYSLKNGKRIVKSGQLCTTNPELREFLVQRVKAWLRESPEARIISVSQNDWYNPCECESCKAVDDREGSHAGTMVALANYVGEKIKDEFPHVAVDTLAYQYTRKAPKTVKPLPNVIVRLCSIECSFAQPLEHPRNAAFADDIREWSRRSDRLYIWDYTTNFSHYILPHPNYFSLGPNVRFFQKHGVKGLFEQGAYQGNGAEMAELRAWVLARLMWDPTLDDRSLIREFCEGYYGNQAAKPILAYLELMASAASDFNLTCFTRPEKATFLSFDTLSKAEALWGKAEAEARGDADLVWRIRQARLPVWYAWLVKWTELRKQAKEANGTWPVPASRKELAQKWLSIATGQGPAGWTPMSHVNEGGLTPQRFVDQLGNDPPD